jgi:DNA polymerase-3 subunit epsilon
VIDGHDNAAIAAAVQGVTALAQRGRFENAARLRDLTADAVEVLWRGQRLSALAAVAELVAAAPDGAGGWQLAIIRHGQLAGAGCARAHVPPMPVIDALRSSAQVVLPQQAPLGGALVEETALIARWLAMPGVRIVSVAGTFASPRHSAGRWLEWAATARSAQHAASEFLAAGGGGSDFLGEARPALEQSLRRPGVDRRGGTVEGAFPGGPPFANTG